MRQGKTDKSGKPKAMVSAAQQGKDDYIVAVRIGRGADAKTNVKKGFKDPEDADRKAKQVAKKLESQGHDVTLTQIRANRKVG